MKKNIILFTLVILVLIGGVIFYNINNKKSNSLKFSDSNNTFTFEYNSLFEASEGEKIPTIDWRVNAKKEGLIIANVFIPKSFIPNTNFSDVRFIVGRSTDESEIRGCLNNATNEEVKDGFSNISGYTFAKFLSNGAGAGNFYETTSYRGIVDGDCYSIEYTIHSTNIGNYSPDQGIKEFDKLKVENELEKIIKSFKFLINSD